MKFVLHRGLEELGKAVGQLTVLLLVVMLVGAPVIAIIAFSIFATLMIAPIVGGGPIATTILVMAFIFAFSFFAGVHVAPHVPIGKAVAVLLEKK